MAKKPKRGGLEVEHVPPADLHKRIVVRGNAERTPRSY
jgi:hypothetical protein